MVLMNYAHREALEILNPTCVSQEVARYMLSLPKFRPHGLHMIIFTKYAVLSLIYACFMEASSVLYSQFPPSTTLPRIYTFILTTLAY